MKSLVSSASSGHLDHNGKKRLSVTIPTTADLEDAEDGGSVTRQLAETATGVREMSKQLGKFQ